MIRRTIGIGCALTASAERIVTGDGKLLELRAVEDVTIVTARQFLAEIAGP